MPSIFNQALTATSLTVCTVLVFAIGSLAVSPLILAGRSNPVILGDQLLVGLTPDDRIGILQKYHQKLVSRPITLTLNGYSTTHQMAELGVILDQDATNSSITNTSLMAALMNSKRQVTPVITIDQERLIKQLNEDFSQQITVPQNANLVIDPAGKVLPTPSLSGESIDIDQVQSAIIASAAKDTEANIELSIMAADAAVQDDEVFSAQQFAESMLRDGLNFEFADQVFHMKPYTVKRLITFIEQVDPLNPKNHILGVKIDSDGLREYLTNTISPVIDQAAANARFKIASNNNADNGSANIRVEQFALPAQGQSLNIDRTVSHVANKMYLQQTSIPLAVDVTSPDISSLNDIQKYGITELIATGESDFAGSPNNRAHNISIGSFRYDGILIPPGEEFSFNEYLGPVTAAAGFKPELVIKSNVTVPEYGGGLCQVSTSMFRAALNAGLEITNRRNHSYAVSYYGKPGLDATIYPPYTDLRFRNNTPSYILIQTRLSGTKLAFDIWGTNDGRQVAIDGPHTYDQGADGSVKAWATQSVVLNNETIIENTFYSRYKSPKLFPKVLAANDKVLAANDETP